jgi:hypothetical protein
MPLGAPAQHHSRPLRPLVPVCRFYPLYGKVRTIRTQELIKQKFDLMNEDDKTSRRVAHPEYSTSKLTLLM